MKKLIVSLAVLAAVTSAAFAQDEIKGVWLTQEENSKIEIYQKGDVYYGKIVWLERSTDRKGNPVTDRNNSDRLLRNRPLMGVDMLEDLAYKKGNWTGRIFAPKRGETMDVVLSLADSNELKVLVSYMGFTREQHWTRDSI